MHILTLFASVPYCAWFLKRVQKNFEGTLIGADRAKDLAVLKVKIILKL